jgi:hypothetical protein
MMRQGEHIMGCLSDKTFALQVGKKKKKKSSAIRRSLCVGKQRPAALPLSGGRECEPSLALLARAHA